MTNEQPQQETWEERQVREKRENAKTRKETRAKLADVFNLLGFTIVERDESREEIWAQVHMRATNKEGLAIYATANGYGLLGRVRFSVDYPKPITGDLSRCYDAPYPEITATLSKTAEQLTADITRRVLPEAKRGLEIALRKNAEVEAYHSARDMNLRAVLGRELKQDEVNHGKTRFDGLDFGDNMSYGSAEAFNDDVNLDLRGVKPAKAAEIIRLLRAAN